MSVEKEVFRQAKASGFSATEIFRKVASKESVEYQNGVCSKHSSVNDRFCVRVFRESGLPYGFGINSPELPAVKEAFRLLGGSFLDKKGCSYYSVLPESTGSVAVDIHDAGWKDGFESVSSWLFSTIKEKALDFPGMGIGKIRFEAKEEKRYVENSCGLNAKYRKTIFSLSIAAEMGGGVIETREDRVFADMLDPVRLISRSYNLISSLQGKMDLNAGDSSFIFTPEAASMILREFAGEFVYSNRDTGSNINYPSVITLLDNPCAHGLCGSAPFDDEGVCSDETLLIDKGFRLDRITDLKGVVEEGITPTGNGYRSERSIFPVPRFTNLYLKPSVLPQSSLMNKAVKGIFISLIRPKYREGNKMTFSVCGYRFRGGELTTPVRFYLKTSMNSFFLNTHMVSREIRFFNNIYNTGAPYVLTEGQVKEDGVVEI